MPALVFDSRFTTYENLSELARQNVRFITPRRRGRELIANIGKTRSWQRIHIPHPP